MKQIKLHFFGLSVLLFGLLACNKDDDAPITDQFTVTIENIQEAKQYFMTGTSGFLAPGDKETITFEAGMGMRLSLATMFVQSNDLFYGFDQEGFELFNEGGSPVAGDITSHLSLWDAGTEMNEEPGIGPNQAPRQSGANTGAAEGGQVRKIDVVSDGFSYPAAHEVITIALSHDGETTFTLVIENVSHQFGFQTPLAPGIWAIHGAESKIFTMNEPSPTGLEALAEDGNNADLLSQLEAETGYVSPFAPGVFVLHRAGAEPIFKSGQPDQSQGLEALAEDGDPSTLGGNLSGNFSVSGVFNTPDGTGNPGALLPGASYSFSITAEEGDYLNIATMLVHSNDLFFAFNDQGIALFSNGIAISGDVTTQLSLWDAGTEVNEFPGAGRYQPARGGGNSGTDENGTVRLVDDGFSYPAVNEMIRITISGR